MDVTEGFDFEAASAQLKALLPASLRASEINRGRMDADLARKQFIEAINRGQKIINYTGHGSVDLWRGELLTSTDVEAMRNRDHLSVFVMMTCLNGYFHNGQCRA